MVNVVNVTVPKPAEGQARTPAGTLAASLAELDAAVRTAVTVPFAALAAALRASFGQAAR